MGDGPPPRATAGVAEVAQLGGWRGGGGKKRKMCTTQVIR